MIFAVPKILQIFMDCFPRVEKSRQGHEGYDSNQTALFDSGEEQLYEVPFKERAAREFLRSGGGTIAEFVRAYSKLSRNSLPQSPEQASNGPGSCIHGYLGLERSNEAYDLPEPDQSTPEKFVKLYGRAIHNDGCKEPCFLVYDDHSFRNCHLNPRPMKRLYYTLLTVAWIAKDHHIEPLVPKSFTGTCDGRLIRDTLAWGTSPPVILDEFSQYGADTFIATTLWIFWRLKRDRARRIWLYNCGDKKQNLDFVKEEVSCGKHIIRAARIALGGSWSLEQMIWILDRIPEDNFLHCRDFCEKWIIT